MEFTLLPVRFFHGHLKFFLNIKRICLAGGIVFIHGTTSFCIHSISISIININHFADTLPCNGFMWCIFAVAMITSAGLKTCWGYEQNHLTIFLTKGTFIFSHFSQERHQEQWAFHCGQSYASVPFYFQKTFRSPERDLIQILQRQKKNRKLFQKRIAKYFFYFKVSSISFPVAQGKGNNQLGEKVSQGIDNTSIKIN